MIETSNGRIVPRDGERDLALLDSGELAQRLANEPPADIVEALNARTPAEAADVLLALAPERAIETLDQPGLDCGPEIVAALPSSVAISLLAGVSADRVADLFRELEEPTRTELLGGLDPETRAALGRLLAYSEDSVGSIMTTEFVSVPSDWTIAQVLHHIRMVERTRETVYSVFVVDPVRHTLVHAVALRRLISGDPNANVLTAAPARRPLMISPLAPRDEAVRLPVHGGRSFGRRRTCNASAACRRSTNPTWISAF